MDVDFVIKITKQWQKNKIIVKVPVLNILILIASVIAPARGVAPEGTVTFLMEIFHELSGSHAEDSGLILDSTVSSFLVFSSSLEAGLTSFRKAIPSVTVATTSKEEVSSVLLEPLSTVTAVVLAAASVYSMVAMIASIASVIEQVAAELSPISRAGLTYIIVPECTSTSASGSAGLLVVLVFTG